jgi:hypothetical protein
MTEPSKARDTAAEFVGMQGSRVSSWRARPKSDESIRLICVTVRRRLLASITTLTVMMYLYLEVCQCLLIYCLKVLESHMIGDGIDE